LLIAGPGGVSICDECVGVCSQLAAGRVPAFPAHPPVETLDTDWLLALLQPLETTIRGKGGQLQWLVDTLRARKISWARIGKALNMSRQSAWERFSKPAHAGRPWRVLHIPAPDERPARER
jgi:ATP-dependent Clp protease ATP-binding subunit ClpX